MRLKLTLVQRLFAAALLCFAVVSGAGVELVRWQFLDNFADTLPRPRDPRVDALAQALAGLYAQHGDWSFLSADPALRTTWLRARVAAGSATPEPDTLADRLALRDAQGHLLAGVAASPWLVAATSIDAFGTPLVVDGHAVGELVLAQAQRPEDDLAVAFLIARQGRLGVAALLGVLACVAAAAGLAASFRRPVRQLVDGARQLEAGDFDARLPATRSDELGELARSFNHLAATLGDTERSRRQWMADTSHELRTPLAVLRGQLEALQDGVRSATPEHVATMRAQVLALTRLVDDLQALTPLPLTRGPVDAWAIVAEAAAAFEDRFRAAGLSVQLDEPAQRALVAGDAGRLHQVFVNLLENSVRHTDAGGRIAISVADDARMLRIAIDDTAPGVPADALGRLGERFFRVDASRSRRSGGTGLGLAVSRQIVEAHGGQLLFEASPLGGLRAVVALPLPA
jgi:two-component system, OmpR family, sensor histidine kinase BaeS